MSSAPSENSIASSGQSEGLSPGHLSAIMGNVAQQIRAQSINQWGLDRRVELIGTSSRLADCLDKLKKFAKFHQSILITGESGAGKEFFAKGCYLMGHQLGAPFVIVNCPQYSDSNTTVSEMFGHVKGSFTGAFSDHTGLFKVADGGAIFLDEIGDLPLSAQTMLLRALAEKEVKPLGASKTDSVNVRVIAATNRDLRKMIREGAFREDLYFRLRYFPLDVPALRDRGEDWKLLVRYYVEKLNAEYGLKKSFSPTALRFLEKYPWPGNVRELRSIVTVGYSMAEAKFIEPDDFVGELQEQNWSAPIEEKNDGPLSEMLDRGRSFWDVIQAPFLDRELNRAQVREIVSHGLLEARGSYRRMSLMFNVDPDQYHKFMDFLRHHRLKPE